MRYIIRSNTERILIVLLGKRTWRIGSPFSRGPVYNVVFFAFVVVHCW